ncbi:peptidyl-prolyl cis-trans isomerase FKBP8-like [Ptychodera flava]|uniref:peptidyl-prolyl cis-trans isomerase FKBP8-like n=1 Tax=Ptychodera flava TaxID=63121 RepID=UPI00396AAA53
MCWVNRKGLVELLLWLSSTVHLAEVVGRMDAMDHTEGDSSGTEMQKEVPEEAKTEKENETAEDLNKEAGENNDEKFEKSDSTDSVERNLNERNEEEPKVETSDDIKEHSDGRIEEVTGKGSEDVKDVKEIPDVKVEEVIESESSDSVEGKSDEITEEVTGKESENVKEIPDDRSEEDTGKEPENVTEIQDEVTKDVTDQDSLDNVEQSEVRTETELSDSVQTQSDERVEEVTTDKEDKETDEKQKDDDNSMDILGNGLLVKKITKAGNGIRSRPIRGQVVTLKCAAYLDEKDEKVEEYESLQFELGEGDVIQALDLGVALMELGEECTLMTDARYAYGELGKEPSIPGGTRLRYEIELLKVEDSPDITIMDTMEKVNRANKKRERGNELYLRGDYSSAINSYTRALTILEDEEVGANKEEYKSVEEEKLKCYNNLAACQLKVEAYDAALKSCMSVLSVEPDNVKALFRKGKVLAYKGETEDAISEMRKAIKIEPANKIIHQELSKLVAKHNQQMQSTKEMCKKMVGDLADMANRGKSASTRSQSKGITPKMILTAVVVLLGAVITAVSLAMKES